MSVYVVGELGNWNLSMGFVLGLWVPAPVVDFLDETGMLMVS